MMKKILLVFVLSMVFSGICCAVDKKDNMDALLIDAVSLYDNGAYSNAKDILLPLSLLPEATDAIFYYLGLCDFALGNNDEAEIHLKKAVDMDPGNFWYRDRLARLYSINGHPEMTTEIYEKLAKDFPKNANVQYALVNLYGELGKPEKMLSSLDEIEAISGKNEMVTLARYDILRQMRKNDEAFAVLENYNNEFTSAKVLAVMGDDKLGQFKDSLALGYYNEALVDEPSYAPAILGKAEVFRIRRDFSQYFSILEGFFSNKEIPQEDKSRYFSTMMKHLDPHFIQTFRNGIDTLAFIYTESAPTDSTTLQATGTYFYSTQRMDKAEYNFKKNRYLFPGSLPIRFLYVQFLGMTEKWDDMLKESEQGWNDFPGEVDFLQMKSAAYFNLKDYRSSIMEEERIIAAVPASDTATVTRVYTGIGDTYQLLGETSKAFQAYEKAIAANPDNAVALNNYAYFLCLEKKQLKKAYKMSRKVIEMEPDNPTYLDTFGWILYTQGKALEAKAFFKHAMLYGGKEQASVLDHYAEVLYALKEYDLAKVYWNLAKTKNTDNLIPDLEERIKARISAIKQ